jgi:hypothetical protein
MQPVLSLWEDTFKEHKEAQLKYMVIERFRPGSKEKVYARYEAKGRMLPDGLKSQFDEYLRQRNISSKLSNFSR